MSMTSVGDCKHFSNSYACKKLLHTTYIIHYLTVYHLSLSQNVEFFSLSVAQDILNSFLACLEKGDLDLLINHHHSLEEGHNLGSQFLRSSESLRVQHNLCNELPVRCGHSQASKQLLQVIREVRTPSITWIHGNEDGHITAHFNLFANQFNSDGCSWKIIIIIKLFIKIKS